MDPKKIAFRLQWFQFKSEYFLFLLPLFFVVHGYTEHYGDIPAKDAIFLGLEYIGYIMLTWLFLSLVFRSARKAAVLTVFFFVFFFFFGAAHDWLKEILEGSFLTSYSFILPFSAAAFGLLFFFLMRTGRTFNRLARYLNAVFLILLAIDGITLVFSPDKTSASLSAPLTHAKELRQDGLLYDTSTAADIHLVMVDEYPGTLALKKVLHFDNTPFEDSLRHRGFHVVKNPRSNYNHTVASIASLFNMDYLSGVKNMKEAVVYRIGRAVINKSPFTDFLTSKGYAIRNFSIFDFAGQPVFENYFPRKFSLIQSNTFLSRVEKDIGYHAAITFKIPWAVEKLKGMIRYEAETSNRIMDSVLHDVAVPYRAPRFFYTHLMMVHSPYHFDEDGNLVQLNDLANNGRRLGGHELYLANLQYANFKLLRFVDDLRKASTRPVIILLMSDHGVRQKWSPVAYHFNTINAVFLPIGMQKQFYPGQSNVNQLRILLNVQFGQRLPLLPDSSILLDWENEKSLVPE